jgi:hypothetical protein
MSTPETSIFKDPNVAEHLAHLYDKYVVVPSNKTLNNILFVCKSHYITLHRLLEKGIRY